MWIVEYKSPKPSPILAAKGGVSQKVFQREKSAIEFAEGLKNKGIEVLSVRQAIQKKSLTPPKVKCGFLKKRAMGVSMTGSCGCSACNHSH